MSLNLSTSSPAGLLASTPATSGSVGRVPSSLNIIYSVGNLLKLPSSKTLTNGTPGTFYIQYAIILLKTS